MTRLADRLRDLDERVMGQPVPDNRPLLERMLRPRPAFWSPTGRFLGALIIVGLLGVAWWSPEGLVAAIATGALLAAAFLVIAAEERKRARRYNGEDK